MVLSYLQSLWFGAGTYEEGVPPNHKKHLAFYFIYYLKKMIFLNIKFVFPEKKNFWICTWFGDKKNQKTRS